MKKKLILAAAFMTAIIMIMSMTRKGTVATSGLIEPDSVFVKEAASSSMMEIQMGEMMMKKATHPRVRAFAEMMVRDHTAASKELKDIAKRKNFRLPETMMHKHSKHFDHLKKEEGDHEDYDKRYIKIMAEGHKDDIDEFEDAAKKAKDADVRAFAAKQLPILKMHRDSAIAIRKALD
mgnify:CR=1 FL=1